MKIKKIVLLIICLTSLYFISCTSQSPSENSEILKVDDLVYKLAEETVTRLPAKESANLAVYYFTVDDNESSISDYLITGLTTEIANRIPSGYTMVSRNGLDRIMDEYSFQLTDLVSEETQVDIGELLGADTIITGFITSLPDRDNINIQIMDVHTGAVVGGFSLDYRLSDDFGRDYSNETIVVERKYEETKGIAAKSIIFENFDGKISEITPSHFEEYWGERIIEAKGETGIDPEGYAYLDFSAEFDSINHISDWNDSDLTFYMNLPFNEKIQDAEGVSLKINPEGFSRIYLFVKQGNNDDIAVFGSPLSLTPGIWNELKVPFANLSHIDGTNHLDPEKKMTLSIGIPYMENVSQFYFGGEQQPEHRLSVDDIGLFTSKNIKPENAISLFEDEINQVLVSLYLDNSYMYMDYSSDDDGQMKRNEGITSQRTKMEILNDGPVGRYLSLQGNLKVNNSIKDFIGNWGELLLVMDMISDSTLKDHKEISFLIRSDIFKEGHLEINDPDEGQSFEAEFQLGNNWSRTALMLSDGAYSSDETPSGIIDNPLRFRYIWTIPAEKLIDAIDTGVLEFRLDIDELKWDKK